MTVRCAIRPANPAAHLFHVTVTLENPDPAGQRFLLPAWVPGSYMIREFARHIVRLNAMASDRRLRVEKLDKHTWRCAPTHETITLAYEVYAWDLSVRAAHLDDTHGFFNGGCVFLLPLGRECEPCRVDLLPPEGRRYAKWRVITGLAPLRSKGHAIARGDFGAYVAADYDELIDCPVEMGTFVHEEFYVLGVPHEIAITGNVPRLDLPRLTADLARLCAAHITLFEPRQKKAPFARYHFLTMAIGDAYGGLEHRNSTALVCRREDLPFIGMKDTTENYRTFLGLASHEYFHTWNVKRIKPAAFVPYDLTRENYTRLLWAFEGFTSYYDDLLLARAGLWTEAQYLEAIGKTVSTVMQRSGRLKQSVADSSFDAWIKYYRQDENTPNSMVSYYQKGALIGLALDLFIRAATSGRGSLDDAMRLLYRRWRDAGADYRGVAENEFPEVVLEATGVDVRSQLREWTAGTRDPDFAALLAPFGIAFVRQAALEQPHFALLGVKLATGAECTLANVFDGSPAQLAGLSGGDTLIALDGLRATAANIDKLLARYRPDDAVEALAFRRDELRRFQIRLASQPPLKFVLQLDAKANRQALRMRRRWLRG